MEKSLPKGWAISTIEESVAILDNMRKPVSATERAKRIGDIPYYGATGLAGYIDDYLFDEELVLVGEDGAPFFDKHKNVAFIITGKSWVNNHAHVLKAKENTLNKFILHYLNQFDYTGFVGGTTRLKLTQGDLRKIPLPLPPLPEQERIVAKLDKLFTQHEKIKKALDRIPQLLKSFRQQVLTQAVTGKLTEQWREGKELGKWKIQTIHDLVNDFRKDVRTGPFGSALKKSDHRLTGLPVWGIESIGVNGKFTGINKIFITVEKAKELSSFKVNGGDIIISRSGTVGELCIIPNQYENGYISTNLLKIALNNKVINSLFFCWMFKADPNILEDLKEQCKGSTRLFLTQTILKNLHYNIAPLQEQQEIVRRVESLFAKADAIEVRYKILKAKIDSLPQAILRKAFRGELVPQLPTDGDAKDLLAEIMALKKEVKGKKK